MIRKRFPSPSLLASFVAAIGLLWAPLGASMAWATSHEKKPVKPVMTPKAQERKAPAMRAEAPTPQLVTPTPTTLDGYLAYVQDRMQLEAMKGRQSGVVDVKLTIAKDGTIERTEVTRVEGPPALRDQVTTVVNRVGKLPPLPADADADVLIMAVTLAFNYPGSELFDRFGQLRSGR
jgi:TonB family protein